MFLSDAVFHKLTLDQSKFFIFLNTRLLCFIITEYRLQLFKILSGNIVYYDLAQLIK